VGEVTSATTAKSTAPSTFIHQWVRSAILSYRFPVFETSAALCGTTGKDYVRGYTPQTWDHHWKPAFSSNNYRFV